MSDTLTTRNATAWVDVHGIVSVSPTCPPDELAIATGDAHVLWHHIDTLARRADLTDGSTVYVVPGFCPRAPIEVKARLCQAFAHALVRAGMTVSTDLAPLDGRVA